jgi:nicotinamidase-related amidase
MNGRALIVIDVQYEYFPGGAWALPDAERTLPNILQRIARAREAGATVLFVQHVSPPGAPVFADGSQGGRLRAELGVGPQELVIRKSHPSAFQDTGLQAHLAGLGIRALDICGYMTQMCCDTTTREAYSRGCKVRLFSDATAARDLKVDGEVIPHHVVHRVSLGALSRFAQIVRSTQAD